MITNLRYWLIERLAGRDISVLINTRVSPEEVTLQAKNVVSHNEYVGNVMLGVPGARW